MSAPRGLTSVSDTALWVAVYRAMETERPDALFRDPYAGKLAGERGREIVDALPHGRQSAWPMIVRTRVLDEQAARFKRVLVITEGLLIYLTEPDVAALAADLAKRPALHWWLLDFATPQLQRFLEKRFGSSLRTGNAEFKFFPEDGAGYFERRGFRAAQVRYTQDEARRLGREMPFAYALLENQKEAV